MFPSNVLALGKANVAGSQTEQKITNLLYDDTIQIISTFELNQIASLTYHEASMASADVDMCDALFTILMNIIRSPLTCSPITIVKALVVTKHCLLVGSEKSISSAGMHVGRHVESLLEYNTAVLAAQQTGATGMLYRLKGGGVDKGGPVRDAAMAVHRLFSDPHLLAVERSKHADPRSLVPVGDSETPAFVSDEMRLAALRRRMEEERQVQIKSNLAKAHDGFGSGYMAKDGKAVVGAAHGIEEMMKMAELDRQRFSDDGRSVNRGDGGAGGGGFTGYKPPDFDLYNEQVNNMKTSDFLGGGAPRTTTTTTTTARIPAQHSLPSASTDLLSLGAPTTPEPVPGGDLLDFSAPTGGGGGGEVADLMGLAAPNATKAAPVVDDPFGLSIQGSGKNQQLEIFSPSSGVTSTPTGSGTSDLLGAAAAVPAPAEAPPPPIAVPDNSSKKKPIMSSGSDRFSALDELGPLGVSGTTKPMGGDASTAKVDSTGLSGLGSGDFGLSRSGSGSNASIGQSPGDAANVLSGLGFPGLGPGSIAGYGSGLGESLGTEPSHASPLPTMGTSLSESAGSLSGSLQPQQGSLAPSHPSAAMPTGGTPEMQMQMQMQFQQMQLRMQQMQLQMQQMAAAAGPGMMPEMNAGMGGGGGGGLAVSAGLMPPVGNGDHDDLVGGFTTMGGAAGSGLEPMGPAPGAPPPPPPPPP